MQTPYLEKAKLTEAQWMRLGEGAYRILTKLKSTEEGRRMLREEIAQMRKEKREAAKCKDGDCDDLRRD